MGWQVEDLFGYPLEQWYDSKLWLETLHPEDVERVERSFMKVVWKGGCGSYRYKVLHRNGYVIRVESHISTVLDGEKTRYIRGLTRALEIE